jgi:Kdo2-lipid IVA lauroyltransferase/acyltransferase
MRIAKRLKRYAVYVAARILIALLLLVPLRVSLSLGRWLGFAAFVLARRDRRRALAQIAEALSATHDAARALALRVFENIGRVAVELAILPRIRHRLRDYVELADADLRLLERALSEKRGVIFVSAHLGSWELLAQRIAAEGFDCATLAKKSSNPYLGEWLVERRAAGGVETIQRGEERAARKMLAALKRGAILGVLIDQDTKVDSVHVPFFGKLAATPTAAAELALRGDIPVVAGFIARRPGIPAHRITLERIAITREPALSKQENVRKATAVLTARIEREIRAHPDEWVWFHARWKTPESSVQLDARAEAR